jgi:glycosyltransferase involved in cell wall biosynthesis
VGWGEGLEPKWVKGPDVWVRVIEQLKPEYNLFVLLVGPARGYVKKELERIGVAYKHVVLSNYLEIPKYYNALDLYLVTSRAEGGPKAIVEAMACGVPLVSTEVGMALDIIKDGHNGRLAEIDNLAALAEKARHVIGDRQLAKRLVNNALNTVKDYSWEKITRQYHDKIYQSFMKS